MKVESESKKGSGCLSALLLRSKLLRESDRCMELQAPVMQTYFAGHFFDLRRSRCLRRKYKVECK